MSLRRKALLVFLVVIVVTFGGLWLYAETEGARLTEVVERVRSVADVRARTAIDGLISRIDEVIDTEISEIIESRPENVELPLKIRANPEFDSWLFRRLVDRAVLVRFGDGDLESLALAAGTRKSWFNLKRRYIFGHGDLDKGEALELVYESLRTNRLEWSEDGRRVAGPLMSGNRPWGGFYLALAPIMTVGGMEQIDPTFPLRHLVLILVPSALFLLWFLWVFLRRGIVEPLEDLGRVARAVSTGDYTRRLPPSERDDEIGRLTVVVNRMLDLVEEYHHEMEARIRQKTDEIERKNQELVIGQRLAATGALASGIAHEINNPLGGMMNALNWLGKQDLTQEQKDRYESLVRDGIERIGGIVRKVLSFSPQKTTPTPIHLADVLRRAVDLVMHRATKRDIEIVSETQGEVPLVLGEAHEVGQIFLNLLINAVDACYDGGRIDVRMFSADRKVHVEVKDNGAGMPPDVADRAFDLFFTTKDGGRGTGLGLATVHSLVEAHGGTIDLWTRVGEGTRFTVSFPALDREPTRER